VNITIFVLQKFVPSAGAPIFSFFELDEIECLQCGNKWKKGEVPKVEEAPPPEEEKVVPSKTFKTEEEFRDWLRKQKLNQALERLRNVAAETRREA
jgi:hypothetical protein